MSADRRLDLLKALGAQAFAHLNGSLVEHLCRTEALLAEWGAPDVVRTAGLFHAIYGTDGYEPALMDAAARRTVALAIGDDAEQIVYLYGACDRDVFHPRIGTPAQRLFADRFSGDEYAISRERLAQLCEITVANEIELAMGSVSFLDKHRGDFAGLLGRMAGLVSNAGMRAARRLLAGAGAPQYLS